MGVRVGGDCLARYAGFGGLGAIERLMLFVCRGLGRGGQGIQPCQCLVVGRPAWGACGCISLWLHFGAPPSQRIASLCAFGCPCVHRSASGPPSVLACLVCPQRYAPRVQSGALCAFGCAVLPPSVLRPPSVLGWHALQRANAPKGSQRDGSREPPNADRPTTRHLNDKADALPSPCQSPRHAHSKLSAQQPQAPQYPAYRARQTPPTAYAHVSPVPQHCAGNTQTKRAASVEVRTLIALKSGALCADRTGIHFRSTSATLPLQSAGDA